jgi:hypothetical protein
VAIVAARVHLARYDGGPGFSTRFGYRQGVHIRPKPDHTPVTMPAANNGDYAGPAYTGFDAVAAKSAQFLGYEPGCLMHIVHELGFLVQMPAPFGDVLLHLMSAVDQRHYPGSDRQVADIDSSEIYCADISAVNVPHCGHFTATYLLL